MRRLYISLVDLSCKKPEYGPVSIGTYSGIGLEVVVEVVEEIGPEPLDLFIIHIGLHLFKKLFLEGTSTSCK